MADFWKYFLTGLYIAVLIFVCIRILFDTKNVTKTLAYLLLVLFLPLFGMLFYLVFGVNLWKKKLYSYKMKEDELLLQQLKNDIHQYNNTMLKLIDMHPDERGELATMLINDLQSPLTGKNRIKLLINGEQKIPELLEAMQQARHHIHFEYYIFEHDETGKAIIELMKQKAREGVEVRFIFDDFGSPGIKKQQIRELQEAGVEVYPFYKVHFYILANRLNYRNHRKIVVIDGKTGFVGGINISDRYVNNGKQALYWRDTHVRIDGPGVYYLQYLFFTDWNFCAEEKVQVSQKYFSTDSDVKENAYVQIAASGPDSVQPMILFSILQMIFLAKKEILITTPYFIPSESIIQALRVAALSGLKVVLLVPGKSDSKVVNAASRAYYEELLEAGVEIYLYQKGFVHAKTMVCDGSIGIVGTANMDNRSFELNFEVNVIIYDAITAARLRDVFFEDINEAEKIDAEKWIRRSFFKKLPEKFARLFSPSL
jgi:cardiolipin synthase